MRRSCVPACADPGMLAPSEHSCPCQRESGLVWQGAGTEAAACCCGMSTTLLHASQACRVQPSVAQKKGMVAL